MLTLKYHPSSYIDLANLRLSKGVLSIVYAALFFANKENIECQIVLFVRWSTVRAGSIRLCAIFTRF
ncbi:hypothetical protein XU18_4721 [Perkinsela sp. CCAP 1560/4]|nr:hypothetical protein XU18_4721 [Perkinsela sp. CCAP 1560/4]|eukprot:KNH00521.1 hypothetical protein XU18_4721 [Perkinsela sp. CCAP 1560/4]